MASYASVAAHNAPPSSEQPHPDQALLNTTEPSHSNVADDAAKINIVSPHFKQDPQTYTSEAKPFIDDNHHLSEHHDHYPKTPRKAKNNKAEAHSLWDSTKRCLLRPGLAGGLVGLVNIGLLASVGRIFYMQPLLRRDVGTISSVVGATVALLSVEGFVAEKYRQTPQGQKAEQIAKKEGDLIFRHLHEQVMRPRVLGGILGIINATILGAVGYLSYANWDKTWNKRTVSSISIGLLTLWGGEGFIAEKYST